MATSSSSAKHRRYIYDKYAASHAGAKKRNNVWLRLTIYENAAKYVSLRLELAAAKITAHGMNSNWQLPLRKLQEDTTMSASARTAISHHRVMKAWL
eukprot:scaffold83355_cov41-Prasinocladus_malaysianus.AAC.1